jgi:rhodanese-related sulfurtransferase/DNA-binding transcriptional ArsR family regulator
MNDLVHRTFKNQIYEQFTRIAKAAANPHRLELLDLLAQSERTVEELAREAEMSVANASQHLQTLRAAGLVEARRAGLYAHYRLADDRVFRLWQAIRDVGEARLADIDRTVATFLSDRATIETIDSAELLSRLADTDVLVLDVRPAEEYRAGHIPGAVSVPVAELDSYLARIPEDREVIVYCRGPYCVFADEAVALLRGRGYQAYRYSLGLPDWRVAGLPVDS